jgi:uncharacterized protein
MRALVFCDDRWHPASTVHEGLAPLSDDFSFDWVETAADESAWTAERLAAYPVVVLSKSNNVSASDHRGWVTERVQEAFLDYVQRGNGLFVVHSGTAGYAEMPILRGLMGGVFVEHPPQCPVTVAPLTGHPLTAGSKAFTAVDEHYFVALDDPQAEVFLTTTSEHGTQPGGWTRIESSGLGSVGGRVCVLTPGHNVEVWLHPSFQTLLRNGLRWCAKAL